MKYVLLIFLICLIECKPGVKNVIASKQITKIDSVYRLRVEGEDSLERRHSVDSVRQDSVLAKLLKYAYRHRNEANFKKDLWLFEDTTMFSTLSFGYIFSKDKKHLIIQNRVNEYEFNENVYLLKGSKFVNVIQETVPDLTFVDDSISDVNGDGNKDFLLNWYPESGCCARNIYGVYLYKKDNGAFSKKFEFMNPDFFPNEGLIRGVAYGHPGEVPLYKFRWDGFGVDTVEYIYPTSAARKKFYIVHHEGDEEFPKRRKIISTVPKEYSKIGGYEWFMLE